MFTEVKAFSRPLHFFRVTEIAPTLFSTAQEAARLPDSVQTLAPEGILQIHQQQVFCYISFDLSLQMQNQVLYFQQKL